MIKLWIITAAASLTLIFVPGREAIRARAAAHQAERELKTVIDQASELVRLRHQGQEASLPERPATGLASRVSAALTQSGLPASTLQSLSPESQSGSGTAIRQRATLNLSGLTLPQLGTFLNAWRGGDYTVSSIDLSPLDKNAAGYAASPGADLPLRAVITLEGVFRNTTIGSPASFSGAKP